MRYWLLILAAFLCSEITAQDLLVQSVAFAPSHYIPYRYTCDGENINPGLRIGRIPGSAKSLALVMMDSTVAFGVFDHWIVWNLPVQGVIKENSSRGVTGRNSRNENKYYGPCPPNGVHEYYFRIYALDIVLDLPASSSKQEVIKAMQGHILAKGELMALFQRE